MYYSPLPFDELSRYWERSVDDLKQESYARLEELTEQMRQEKATQIQKQNQEDKEYQRIVKKYFSMMEFLRQWWTEEEIILAVSRHAAISDLVSIRKVRAGSPCYDSKAEYVETKMDILPRYTKTGEQLLMSETARCDLYRIPSQYQSGIHGKIVLDLLYQTYPQLKPFDFQAYGYHSYDADYEIYPKNHIYTPFAALMEGDVDRILKRNRSYAKSYNHGIFTESETEKRLQTPEVLHYLDVVRSLKTGGVK